MATKLVLTQTEYIHVGYIAYDYTELKNTSQPKNTAVKTYPVPMTPNRFTLNSPWMERHAKLSNKPLQRRFACRYRSTVQLMGTFTSLILGHVNPG